MFSLALVFGSILLIDNIKENSPKTKLKRKQTKINALQESIKTNNKMKEYCDTHHIGHNETFDMFNKELEEKIKEISNYEDK